MLLVITVVLLFLLLPATVVGVPVSKIVITVTNTNPGEVLWGGISARGAGYHDTSLNLYPGESQVISWTVNMGTYEITANYVLYDGTNFYQNYQNHWTVKVSLFETETLTINL